MIELEDETVDWNAFAAGPSPQKSEPRGPSKPELEDEEVDWDGFSVDASSLIGESEKVGPTRPTEGPQQPEPNPLATGGAPATQGGATRTDSMKALMKGVGHGLGSTAEGVAQAASSVIPGLEGLGATSQLVHDDREKSYEELKEKHPFTARAGRFIGEAAPMAAVPGGVAGSLAKRIGTGALAGAGVGFAQYVEPGSPEEMQARRAKNFYLGAALGGSAPALFSGAKAIIGRGKGLASKGLKSELEALTPAAKKSTDEAVEAASRLKTQLTPGEATSSVAIKAHEARIPITEDAQKRVTSTLLKREETLKQRVKEVVASVAPKGVKATKEEATKVYKAIRDVPVPLNVREALAKNEILTKHYIRALKDPESGMKTFKPRTIGQLDRFKKVLDDKIANQQAGGGVASRELIKARGVLVDTLDQVDPNYKKAREISAQYLSRKSLEDEISKVALKAGQTEPTSVQIYDKIMGTPGKQAELLAVVEQTGGNVKQAKDVMKVLSSIKGSKFDKLLTKDLRSSGEKMGGSVGRVVRDKIQGFVQKKYNKALLDLTLDPKWMNQVQKLETLGSRKAQVVALTGLVNIAAVEAEDAPKPGEVGVEAEENNPVGVDPESLRVYKKEIMNPDISSMEMPPIKVPKASPETRALLGAPDAPLRDAPKTLSGTQGRTIERLQTKAINNAPEDLRDDVERLLDMSSGDYYEKFLKTPQLRRDLVRYMRDAGATGAQVQSVVGKMKKIQELEDKIKRAENNPKGGTTGSFWGDAFFGYVASVATDQAAVAAFYKSIGADPASRAKRERDLASDRKKRDDAILQLLGAEIGTIVREEQAAKKAEAKSAWTWDAGREVWKLKPGY